METQTNIILKDGNFYRETVSYQNLGPQSDLVSRFANRAPVYLRDVFSVAFPSPVQFMDAEPDWNMRLPVALCMRESTAIFAVKLPYWPLYGRFRTATLLNSDESEPANAQTILHWSEDEASPKLLRIAVPTRFATYLLISMDKDFPRKARGLGQCTVFAVCVRDDGTLRRPSFPNIFDSSKVCMGYDFVPNGQVGANRGFSNIVDMAVSHLVNSESNLDLCHDKVYNYCRFRIDSSPLIDGPPVYVHAPISSADMAADPVDSHLFSILADPSTRP